jgi:hypothetical protein
MLIGFHHAHLLAKGLGLRLFRIISQRPNGQHSQQCQQKTSLPMLIQMRRWKYFPATSICQLPWPRFLIYRKSSKRPFSWSPQIYTASQSSAAFK